MANIEQDQKHLEESISQIKSDLEGLQKDFDEGKKNKDEIENQKEALLDKVRQSQEINKKLQETAEESGRTIKDKIAQTDEELKQYQETLENLNITAYEIKEETEDKEKGRRRRQRDGVTSKEEWRDHKWRNIGRIAMGIGAVSLARWGIKKLFGISKKKDKAPETTDGDKKDKPFWQTGFGKFLKRTGIGTGIYYLSHGLYTGKRSLKDFGNWSKNNDEATDHNQSEDEDNNQQISSEQSTDPVENIDNKPLESSGTKQTKPGKSPQKKPETSVENTALSKEEEKKRNEYIKKSIEKATSIPAPIDYGTDKTTLEAKGCPKEIGFDVSKQAIVAGDIILKLQIPSFETDTARGRAKVDSIHFDKIEIDGEKIILTITGTGTLTGGILARTGASQTKTQTSEISKAKFWDIISPYYENNKKSYSLEIPNNDSKVPLNVSV